MGEGDVQRKRVSFAHVLGLLTVADILSHGRRLVWHTVGVHGSGRVKRVLVGAHACYLVGAGGEDMYKAGVQGID